METKKQNIGIIIAIIIFTIFTAHFYFLIQFFLPLLKKVLSIHTSVYWYLTGYLLFIPIFLLAVILCRKEGFKSRSEILTALNIKKFTKKDFKYAIISLILLSLVTIAFLYFSAIALSSSTAIPSSSDSFILISLFSSAFLQHPNKSIEHRTNI